MAVLITVHAVCDRCQKPFEEQRVKQGEEIPVVARDHMIAVYSGPEDEQGNLKQVFRFDDLCPKCVEVVDKEIKRIRLEKEEKDKQTNGETKEQQSAQDHNF